MGNSPPAKVIGGVTYVQGPFGAPALKFDNATGYVDCGLNGNTTFNWATPNAFLYRPRTFWAWVRRPSSSSVGPVFSKGNNSPNSGWSMSVTTTGLRFGWVGSSNGAHTTSNVLSVGDWHLIAIAWDGGAGAISDLSGTPFIGGMSIYLDGVWQGAPNTGSWEANGSQNSLDQFNLWIGQAQYVGGSGGAISQWADLEIDHWGLDYRVYSPEEIADLYRRPFRSFAPSPIFRKLIPTSVNYTDSVTEVSTASDSSGATVAFAVSATEAATASDSDAGTMAATVSSSETGTATESSASTLAAVGSVTESASAADTADNTAVQLANAAELGNALDIETASYIGVVIDSSESVDSSELTSATAVSLVAIAESAAALDAGSATIATSVAMVEAASAGVQSIANAEYLIAESASASDSINSHNAAISSASESANAMADASATGGAVVSVVETNAASTTSVAGKTTRAFVTEAASAATTQGATKTTSAANVATATASDDDNATTKLKLAKKSIDESANATTTQALGPYTTTANRDEVASSAVVSSASYIGLVQVTNEATVADSVEDVTAQFHVDGEGESASATDDLDAVIDSQFSVAEPTVAGDQFDAISDTNVGQEDAASAVDTASLIWVGAAEAVEAAFAIDSANGVVVVQPASFHIESAQALDSVSAERIVNTEINEPTDNLTEALDTSDRTIATFADIEEIDPNAADQSATLLGIGRVTEAANLTDACDCVVIFAAMQEEFAEADDIDIAFGLLVALETEHASAIDSLLSTVGISRQITEHAVAVDSAQGYLKTAAPAIRVWEVPGQDRNLVLSGSDRTWEVPGQDRAWDIPD
jgi:hypothetical protein